MRILEGAVAARYVRKLEQRNQKFEAIESRVRRIISSVRQEDLAPLEARVKWLAEQGDPQRAWMRALAEVFERGGFGLGLTRIASEGGCRISLRMVGSKWPTMSGSNWLPAACSISSAIWVGGSAARYGRSLVMAS